MREWRERVARAMHETLAKVDVLLYIKMPDNAPERLADAAIAELLPLVKAELAKVADETAGRECGGLRDADYRKGIRWCGDRIKDAIKAWEPEA